MKKVVWMTGKIYHVKEFAEIIRHDQWRNPFCEKIDNRQYMEDTKRYYETSFMTGILMHLKLKQTMKRFS